jgi:hypothetical protein
VRWQRQGRRFAGVHRVKIGRLNGKPVRCFKYLVGDVGQQGNRYGSDDAKYGWKDLIPEGLVIIDVVFRQFIDTGGFVGDGLCPPAEKGMKADAKDCGLAGLTLVRPIFCPG